MSLVLASRIMIMLLKELLSIFPRPDYVEANARGWAVSRRPGSAQVRSRTSVWLDCRSRSDLGFPGDRLEGAAPGLGAVLALLAREPRPTLHLGMWGTELLAAWSRLLRLLRGCLDHVRRGTAGRSAQLHSRGARRWRAWR